MRRDKNMMMAADINDLPVELLMHILTFASTSEAAKTCVLSKSWQFVWANLPVLKFRHVSEDRVRILEFLSGIRRTLSSRTSNDLEKFKIVFNYQDWSASHVNALVEYCLTHGVKHMSLSVWTPGTRNLYKLPVELYSNSTLLRLSLKSRFDIAPQRTIHWSSLRRLDLYDNGLSHNFMENLLSGCPVLFELNIKLCWGLRSLDINCKYLHVLKVIQWKRDGENGFDLEISAPYVNSLTLEIDDFVVGSRMLRVSKVSRECFLRISFLGFGFYTSSLVLGYMLKILEDTKHVKQVELNDECVQGLAALFMHEHRMLGQSGRQHLILSAPTEAYGNHVVLWLLDSSPDLEKFSLKWLNPETEEPELFSPGDVYLDLFDLKYDLLHLKTVTITCCTHVIEPTLILVGILLKRAVVLEKMVIDLKNFELRTSTRDYWGDMDDIVRLLNRYPKSSPSLEVVLLR